MSKVFIQLTVIILVFSLELAAEQLKIVTSGSTTHALISRYEPNRITVVDDRIKSVVHKSGIFSIQDNKEVGDVFITPSSSSNLQTLSLFVHTEKNKTYQLILTPQEMPAQNLVLRPAMLEQSAKTDVFAENRGSELVKIMKAMWSGDALDNYFRNYPTEAIKSREEVKVILLETLENNKYQGSAYEVMNISRDSIAIDEKDFFKNDVLAIHISKRNIRPNEVSNVYLVRGK